MGFEPGGRADKLGNRHEGRWVAKQLLRLLNEEIKSVAVEAIGDDEKGVDLQIELNNGVRQAQQCKARNSSKEFWSISDLKARDIISNIRFQLDRDPKCEFTFVSGIPAKLFCDICNSARNSNGDAEAFYKFQIQEIGQSRRDAYRKLCQGLLLDADDPNGRLKAFDYFQRIRVELYPDDDNTRDDLLTWAGLLYTGKPETLIAVLRTYPESNDKLGSPIYVDELRKYLETQSFYPKNLTRDIRISPTIERLKNEFIESICPRLICDNLISRTETESCFDYLKSESMIIIHGSAGSGKSSVLYELTCRLESNNILWVPLRIDRRIPENTAKQYGDDMGFPDSPVNCMIAVAGERKCVLILDQLDAIRWTGMHSASALDVCKEMIRQVLAFKRAGKDICVILSCRTFDMEHDREIRNWLANNQEQQWAKVEMKPLPEESVQKIVGEYYTNMTIRQRNIVSNPQNLAMWVELSKDGYLPLLKSSTGLMREFWALKRQQMEEKAFILVNDINFVQETLVDWLERNGKISAPSRVIDCCCSSNAIKAFKSFGIIQEQTNRISFCHQSYLDFLIAIRLIDNIENGGNILDWLGQKEKQSLFRREQLRQALALLMEESPNKFFISVEQIISSGNIRFHLKHLVLELIGQMDELNDSIADFLLNLLQGEYWKQHIIEMVCFGHVPFVKLLIDKGIIAEWLYSKNVELENRSLLLLRSVNDKMPDNVTELLLPFVNQGNGWGNRILSTICWRVTEDSNSMFELRLQLARKGVISNVISWKDFSEKFPSRTLNLIEAIISKMNVEEKHENNGRTRLENLDIEDFKVLSIVAEKLPADMWNSLIPHLERLTSFEIEPYDPRLQKWHKDHLEYGDLRIERAIVEAIIKAGQILAKNQPSFFLEKVKSIENTTSQILQEIFIEVFALLPDKYSDFGIKWLLNDHKRLQLGDGTTEPKWMPTVRLLKSLSPLCSLELFRTLEDAIIYYHEPDEKQTAEYYLKARREGYFGGHYWGEAQFFFLPVLSPNRIKKTTAELISVLKRRYKDYSESSFLHFGRITGGWVGSKIDNNINKLSDNTWLRIIKSEKVLNGKSKHWKQVDNDNVQESSVRQFSRSLSRIAKQYPERFGKLALQFPENTHPNYISSIIDAMALTKPDNEVAENIKPIWEAASFYTVSAICKKFSEIDDRNCAISLCRLIENRASDNWSSDIIEKLLNLAVNHPDLEPGKLNVSCDKSAEDVDVNTLFQNTINCVRGVAAEAIGRLLWEHPNWFEQLKPGIESLLKDPHPVVRMASIHTLIPVLRINKKLAVNWFITAAKNDTRIPTSPNAIEFLKYTVNEYADQFTPIFKEIINSNYSDALNKGAQMVTAYNLFYGLFNDELLICSAGSVPQRKGVAEIAIKFISNKEYSSKCREIIIQFMNDPDKEVRDAVSRMFYFNILDLSENIPLVMQFVKSQAFGDNSFGVFHCLEAYKESMIPFYEIILETCESISTTFLENTRNIQTRMGHVVNEISLLLLRLYEQTQEFRIDIACRCLDAWDVMFENRVGSTRDLTNSIEK